MHVVSVFGFAYSQSYVKFNYEEPAVGLRAGWDFYVPQVLQI